MGRVRGRTRRNGRGGDGKGEGPCTGSRYVSDTGFYASLFVSNRSCPYRKNIGQFF